MIDVLIVGGGPVGLTLGVDLLRRGVSCRVIERSPTLAIGTRARGISSRTQEIFESLSLLCQLREFAEPALPTRFYDRNNRLVSERLAGEPAQPTPDVPFPNPLMVSQENTDAVLHRRLHELGGAVTKDCVFVSFSQDDCNVTANVIRSGKHETLTARYLVGCDGGGSAVRKCAGISFIGETWSDAVKYLIGNLPVKGMDHRYWHVWTDPDWGFMTLQPIVHGDIWLFVATIQGQELEEVVPTEEFIQQLFERRTHNSELIFGSLRWYSVYRRNLRAVDKCRVGRVFLAGDSAHVGVEHGMNIGIQEACNLSWKLAQVLRGAPEKLLDTYEEERLPISRGILDGTLNRERNNTSGAAAAQSIRDAIASKKSANDPTQLSVSYRSSRLSRDFAQATAIRSGDRAPDSPDLEDTNGQVFRLFDVLDSRKFTLLHFSNGQTPEFRGPGESLAVYRIIRPGIGSRAAPKTLIDTKGFAYRVYGVDTEALVLVRPDGHVAATGTPGQASEILQHLELATPCSEG